MATSESPEAKLPVSDASPRVAHCGDCSANDIHLHHVGADGSGQHAAKRNHLDCLRDPRRSRPFVLGSRLVPVAHASFSRDPATLKATGHGFISALPRCRLGSSAWSRCGEPLTKTAAGDYGSIRRPVAALMTASVRVAAPSFGARIVDVKIDGALGQAEYLRDLHRGLAPRHPGQHLDFALVEPTVFGHRAVRATPASRAVMMAASTSKSMGLVT